MNESKRGGISPTSWAHSNMQKVKGVSSNNKSYNKDYDKDEQKVEETETQKEVDDGTT